jgi:hypothetical protein
MKFSGMGSDSHAEPFYAHSKQYERCYNCDDLVEEGEIELIEIKDYWGRDVKMSVCRHCAAPVEIRMHFIGGSYYISFSDGLGRYYRSIEVTGSTKEEALQNFRGKYVETFDRDLIRFKLIVK